MARFRVAEHDTWRSDAEPAPKPAATPAKTGPGPIERLEDRVRSLGAVGLPARVFDRVFGGVAHRRRSALFAVQALLFILAAILVATGVTGKAVVAYDVGDYTPAAPAGTTDAFLAPGSSTRYYVQVAENRGGSPAAIFGHTEGRIAVPTLGPDGPAYALEIRIVRHDPHVQPRVLVGAPGESSRTVEVASDNGVTMRMQPLRFTEPGTYQVLLTSKGGKGDVDLQMRLMSAPVDRSETSPFTWLPILAGGGLAVIALGAITPGARLLRERRRLLLARDDRVYAWLSSPEPSPRQKGFARIVPFRGGVMAWDKPGREVPERLARLPGNGWVIRLD